MWGWDDIGLNRNSIQTQGEVGEIWKDENKQRQHINKWRGRQKMGEYGNNRDSIPTQGEVGKDGKIWE